MACIECEEKTCLRTRLECSDSQIASAGSSLQLDEDPSLLGVCSGPGTNVFGKVFLSGPRKGQCCWSSGYKEVCSAGPFSYWAATMPPPPPRTAAGAGTAPAPAPARPGFADSKHAAPGLDVGDGNSGCLIWTAAKDGVSQSTTQGRWPTPYALASAAGTAAAPKTWMPCRAVSLDTSPPGVEVGKLEGVYCFFTARWPDDGVARPTRPAAACANGTTATTTPACNQYQVAKPNPLCKDGAWATYEPRANATFAANAVVAGFRSNLGHPMPNVLYLFYFLFLDMYI